MISTNTKSSIERFAPVNTVYVSAITTLTFVALFAELINSQQQQQQQQQQHQQPQTPVSYLPRPDTIGGRPQLMVATYCASDTDGRATLYHNQYIDLDTKKWRSDRDPSAVCTQEKRAILNYCQKVYPGHDIRNIVESSRPYKVDNWCRLGSSKRRCRTKLIVKPFRCLEGTFQSDALLVPERCVFDHVHNRSTCESPDHWNRTASEHCQAKGMKAQSIGMLQPCGIDLFSGVEFVCCQASSSTQASSSGSGNDSSKLDSSPEGNSFAQAANGLIAGNSHWSKNQPKYDLSDAKFNEIKTDDGSSANTKSKQNDQQDSDEGDDDGHDEQDGPDTGGSDDDDDDEYEEGEDEYDDDSSSWIMRDKSSSTASPSTTTTTTSTTTTTTTTTERPVDYYLSHFDLSHEHDDFRRAELAVESSYRDKITHVAHDWSQLNGRYEEMKKKDPQAAEEYKKKMTHQFQKIIESLEEEGAAERHQLASMHAERAMAIINRRKKSAMDCLTRALDRIPIPAKQVERCIVRLLKALEKDRTHTLRQYKNLLNLNTREALREKSIILDHLVTLNKAASQSIAMLDRSPNLAEKLKGKIIAFWHKLRNIPLDAQVERESELKVMEKFEEEVAQQKIERERQRLDLEAKQSSQKKLAPTQQVLDNNNNNNNNINNIKNSKQQQNIASTQSSNTDDVSRSVPVGSNGPVSESSQSNTTITPVQLVLPKLMTVEETNVNAGQQQQQGQAQISQSAGTPTTQGKQQLEETHYHIDSARFSHLKSDTPLHELSYSVRHDPIDSRMLKLGYTTLMVSTCAIVLVVALIGMKYYNSRSQRAYRRQGFAEVGRTCPEEKSVMSMQFNGYENPAYKFYEAEA